MEKYFLNLILITVVNTAIEVHGLLWIHIYMFEVGTKVD